MPDFQWKPILLGELSLSTRELLALLTVLNEVEDGALDLLQNHYSIDGFHRARAKLKYILNATSRGPNISRPAVRLLFKMEPTPEDE